MASKTPKISDAEFVALWQQSRSLCEIAALAGYATPSGNRVASNRAARLRERGVRLRRMNGTTPGDVRRLNLVARRMEASRNA